ncbi:SCO family protein [Patulibacter brassicae]|uniref:SCO family protein n=1 Tax=Patulibacter brassicae TaxID=1705717 RepID=A0ABU4VEH0_9ACTN|nr:SCO family protein [Patulibacter brassicae]MDX8150190.1 SCO family protein [Patulibacter brassicae]
MNPRAFLALLVSGVVVLAVLVVLAVALPTTVTIEDGIQASGSAYRGAARDGGTTLLPSPPFRLRDQDGQIRTVEQLRGRPAIVTFLYTSCEDTSPAIARQIASALDDVKTPVSTLIISVDPQYDDSEAAQRYLNKMNLRGRASYLLGTRQQLEPVWDAYRIQPQGEAFDHSAYVLVLDHLGRQRVAWPADKLTSDGLAHDVGVVSRLSRTATGAG